VDNIFLLIRPVEHIFSPRCHDETTGNPENHPVVGRDDGGLIESMDTTIRRFGDLAIYGRGGMSDRPHKNRW
jgi:hypothetical protein